jgi:DNA-binding NarL/FixJ family response regulator
MTTTDSAESSPACSTRSTQPIRVMIVDDDPVYLEFISELLANQENVKVVGAFSSGSEALGGLDPLEPDLALIDVLMGGMDGITCAKEIVRRRPKTAVIMVSGMETITYCEEAVLSGACGFLSKPFGFDQLKAAICSGTAGLSVLPRAVVERLKTPRPP